MRVLCLWGGRSRLCHLKFVTRKQSLITLALFNLNFVCFLYSSWFHGSISRDEAEHLLQPRDDGLFLVRESTNFPGDYTLCVCFQGKVEHYRVKYLDNKLTIDDEEYFENLGQLVAVRY